MKTLDAGIPLLHIEFEVKAAEHTTHQLSNVMELDSSIYNDFGYLEESWHLDFGVVSPRW
jgi:hypothetical protein